MIDIDKCTVQEACDYAVKKIVEQGCRCVGVMDVTECCLYEDGKGNHCAIGHLLPKDSKLMKLIGGVNDLFESSSCPQLIKENLVVFSYLQAFHDGIEIGIQYNAKKALEDYGIDTSGEHWNRWVEMCDE